MFEDNREHGIQVCSIRSTPGYVATEMVASKNLITKMLME
jgi:hypothetical protein